MVWEWILLLPCAPWQSVWTTAAAASSKDGAPLRPARSIVSENVMFFKIFVGSRYRQIQAP